MARRGENIFKRKVMWENGLKWLHTGSGVRCRDTKMHLKLCYLKAGSFNGKVSADRIFCCSYVYMY